MQRTVPASERVNTRGQPAVLNLILGSAGNCGAADLALVREEKPICRNSQLNGLSEKKVTWSNDPYSARSLSNIPSFAGLSSGANFRSLAMLQPEAQSPLNEKRLGRVERSGEHLSAT
jgi:hypothetical protein